MDGSDDIRFDGCERNKMRRICESQIMFSSQLTSLLNITFHFTCDLLD